jgi:hypothetical protein
VFSKKWQLILLAANVEFPQQSDHDFHNILFSLIGCTILSDYRLFGMLMCLGQCDADLSFSLRTPDSRILRYLLYM